MKSVKTVLVGVSVIGGVLLLAGGLAYWKYQQFKQPPPPAFEQVESVVVVPTKLIPWRPTADLVGTVFAIQSVMVSNEVAGTVKDVNFDSGQLVEAGAVLLTLDDSTERAELASSEASIRAAESNTKMVESDIGLAETKVRRMRQAVDNKAAPEMDMDEATAGLTSAKANLDRMKAEIESAKARAEQIRTVIAKKTLKAPFKARAGIRTVQPGQYLKEGSDIVGLQSITDTIYLDFAIPQEHMARVKPGDYVMATSSVLGNEPTRIDVVAVDAAVNRDTRNVRVRALVQNPNERLKPGMFVDVKVPVGEESQFISIPNTAIRRAPFGDHVFVVVPGDKPGSLKASQRFIKTGPNIGGDVIILDGLKDGEKVAADGSFKLREGVTVVAGPTAPAGGAPGGPSEKTHETAEAKK
jgi:membrane fusion protein (multidrug efflux system)